MEIITFILITRLGTLGTLPTTFTMLKALMELAYVEGTILPGVLTTTVRFPIFILSSIGISIFEKVCPLTMLQALFPFPFISISILPCVYPIPFSLRVSPFSYI
jgi:hypothetical protein